MNIKVQMSYKFNGLREAYRYKVLFGGRAGGKTWAVGINLVTEGSKRPIRVACARETLASMKQSVHELLKGMIKMLGLEDFYQILDNEIRGANGTTFFYMGLDLVEVLEPEHLYHALEQLVD